ncbi:MAG: hypothetical protein IKR09_06295 [Alphaproteobacteria bacterium]|nr:hypothetical protein [Alphaproteobacteria bacterium]
MMMQLLKEFIFDNTVFVTSLQDLREVEVLGAKKFKGNKQCAKAKENIKSNFSKIEQLNFITAKSIKELFSKINIPCSEKELREKFYNLKYYENSNDGIKALFRPIYGQYVYAKDKKRLSRIGGTRDILSFSGVFLFEMNEKKCELSSDNIRDADFIPNDSFNFYINDQEYAVSSKNKRILSLTIKEKKDRTGIYQTIKDCVLIKEEKEQKNER